MTRPGFHTASVDAKQTHTCVHVAAGGNVFRSELFLLDAYQSHKVTIFYNSTAVQCGFLSASSSKLARIRWRRARPRWRPTTTRRPHPHVQEPEAPHARLSTLIFTLGRAGGNSDHQTGGVVQWQGRRFRSSNLVGFQPGSVRWRARGNYVG